MTIDTLEVLKMAKKGITPKSIILSSARAKKAGMKMMIFTILGLGGRKFSDVHVLETAKVLNQVNPDDIRILSLGVKPGTGFEKMIADGSFTLLSETI